MLTLALAALWRCSPAIPSSSPQTETTPASAAIPEAADPPQAPTLILVGSSYAEASEILGARGLRDQGFPWDMIAPQGCIVHTFFVGPDEALLIDEEKQTGRIASMVALSNWRKGKAHGQERRITEYDAVSGRRFCSASASAERCSPDCSRLDWGHQDAHRCCRVAIEDPARTIPPTCPALHM